MPKIAPLAVCVLVALQLPQSAFPQAPDAAPPPLSRFVGTWVGTQSWDLAQAPPGARADQPVALEIELVDGQLVGTMRPFLGGEDGATFTEARLVGAELQATAAIGPPRAVDAGDGGRGGGRPRGWKDAVTVTFAFSGDALNLTGTADVQMNDVRWMTFRYELSKRRSRYEP